MAKVVLNDVCKTYDDGFKAVKNVSLEIADKEFVVLVGPSGCGKSTTLRMIAGLESVSSGSISIGEKVVNHVAPKDRDIAMVFQNYALYPHMTVFENMAFGLKLRGLPKAEIRARVEEATRILGLEEHLGRKPKQLSGGQRQRVALGRAIVRKPKVFLFDEPLSNLDAKMRQQMRIEIARLHRHLDSTMIYVTHDQVEAMTLGDRICVMNFGEIQQVAAPLELYDHPVNRFVAGFIGTPPMNFIDGEIREECGEIYFVSELGEMRIPRAKWSCALPAKLTLGIRPEEMLGPESDCAAEPMTFTAVVEMAEIMGSETIYHLSRGGGTLVWRSNSHFRTECGGEIRLAMIADKIHFFDTASGKCLI